MRFRLLWLASLAPCVAMAAGPSAQEILTRAASAYKSLKSYQFQVTVQTIRGESVSESRLTVSGVKPGKFRIEDARTGGELRVSDGQNEWTFNRAADTYGKAPARDETAASVGGLERIDEDVTSASISREETFAVNGKPRPIYVVRVIRKRWPEGVPDGVLHAMYRIDRETFAVYKVIYYTEGTLTQVVLYDPLAWNQPLPDSLFAFTPPASAREAPSAAAFSVEPSPIAGLEAPDFTLPDMAGRPVRLRDLRGKVVVVDFWATWCPPCRAQMPMLERMKTELGPKGLVVLALDVGEDGATVAAFAKRESYTFTILMNAEPEVTSKYYVEAYPTTFVVDREGRIAFREMGGGSPDKLRAAVEAALSRPVK